jgi:hypothetical protein
LPPLSSVKSSIRLGEEEAEEEEKEEEEEGECHSPANNNDARTAGAV